MTTATDVCTRCAMCCDGTLFGHVPVEPDELDRLQASWAARASRPTDRRQPPPDRCIDRSLARLEQPCPVLEAARCTAYDARPSACARYRCRLLVSLEEGRVDEAQATALVERARGLARDLAHLLSVEQRSRGLWRGSEARLDELGRSPAPRDRATLGEIVRLRMVLSLLVVQHFDPEAARLGAVQGG